MREPIARALRALLFLLAGGLFAAGCAGLPPPVAPIPFSVEMPDRAAVRAPAPDPAAVCSRPEGVAAAVAPRVEPEAGLCVLPEGRAADLKLELEVRAGDEGWGEPEVTSAAWLTTISWFLAGVPSWWVRDRAFRGAQIELGIRVRDVARGGAPILDRSVPLDDIRLSFVDRASASGWLLQLVCPPSFIGGDADKLRAALSEKVAERARVDVPRILASDLGPALYASRPAQLLLDFPPPRSLVLEARATVRAAIASRVPLRAIAVAASGSERLIQGPALLDCRLRPGEEAKRIAEEIRTRMGGEADGVAPLVYVYRFGETIAIPPGLD
ncbi:MAG: hypothetical protein JXP34_18175, partial [Planctomycetes bacterium]|nr:hypothetical protein [Planctomycetota bacterium]